MAVGSSWGQFTVWTHSSLLEWLLRRPAAQRRRLPPRTRVYPQGGRNTQRVTDRCTTTTPRRERRHGRSRPSTSEQRHTLVINTRSRLLRIYQQSILQHSSSAGHRQYYPHAGCAHHYIQACSKSHQWYYNVSLLLHFTANSSLVPRYGSSPYR